MISAGKALFIAILFTILLCVGMVIWSTIVDMKEHIEELEDQHYALVDINEKYCEKMVNLIERLEKLERKE